MSQHDRLNQSIPVTSYTIEIVAMLERALAMAYTGDARVITKALMEPFGLHRSLIELGIPCLISSLNYKSPIGPQLSRNPSF